MKNKLVLALAFSLLFFQALTVSAKKITTESPNKEITLSVDLSNHIAFSIDYKHQSLLKEGVISMELLNETLGENPKLLRSEKGGIDEIVCPVVPLKNSAIRNNYNVLTLYFQKDYQLEFRVFDNGVSYRFITTKQGDITVVDEHSNYLFDDNYRGYISKTERTFSNYEHVFTPIWLQDFNKEDLAVLPLFVDEQKAKILIAEADLHDYPAMFINGDDGNAIKGWFPRYPEETGPVIDHQYDNIRVDIFKEGDYIAKTTGNRTFPWRVFAIGEQDKDIVTNDLVYLLSMPSESSNFDWIKPGQVAWDWWNGYNVTGVDFKVGMNTETYKFYIDFASEYGLKYAMLDGGWSYSAMEITRQKPEMDLEELVEYGKQKNVKLFLWASWLAVENTPSFLDYAKKLGVAGVKIDFMDRSDQWMMNFYERTAKKAFKNGLLVDFHGSISPKGLRRTYPNIVAYEGVCGMEQNLGGGFDTPNNHVMLPFTRNVVGPMDYTPGAMQTVHQKYWHAHWISPMSISTRVHQLALYVVFESGLQMLSDSPIHYRKENECAQFIADVPNTWDETVVLDGKIGEYIIIAKRKGDDWFVGGITNDKEREIDIDFSFLKKNTNFLMTMFTDGVNSDRNAMDYKKETQRIESNDKMSAKMNSDGGFAAKLTIQ
ncbi:glycoside hydrolase family 97 protein [Sunxiuqinia sp. A32]|uniref:glycoside hydrolase family 97 protein n=1 Tax=Sunxiuqinia sp. A32 TaxID=3461496 RepID=UPI004045EE7C